MPSPVGHAIEERKRVAIVQDLLIVVLNFEPPHPVPPWMWAISLAMTPPAIIYGDYLRSRPKPTADA